MSDYLEHFDQNGAHGLGLGKFSFEQPTSSSEPRFTPSSSTSDPTDLDDYSLSSFRQQNTHPAAFDDLWPELWLHPNIHEVTTRLVQDISAGPFTHRSAWLLMHICDLQIVYQLSSSAEATNSESFLRIEIPQNAILQPTLILRCAEVISVQHVKHHLPPDCFMEREIQLRALVSVLSLLQLFPASAGRPRLSASAAECLRQNILNLSIDLHNSRGSAADKGDCEFMIRYALNLLSFLPSDETATVKVVSNFAHLAFAAGMAYQYNGPSAIKHLKQAFRQIQPKASKWHTEFDQYHHLTIIVISWSLYCGDPKARHAFRQLCSDLIAQLRQKLRDGLAVINEKHSSTKSLFWGKIASRTADLVGTVEPYDSPIHLTYGLMYLIERLVKRFIAEGGGKEDDERENLDELRRLLIGVCQTSKFDEIKFKAYEILFSAFINIFSLISIDLSSYEHMTALPRGRSMYPEDRRKREQRNRELSEECSAHMDALKERQDLVKHSLTGLRLDVAAIRESRKGYEDIRGLKNKQNSFRLIENSGSGSASPITSTSLGEHFIEGGRATKTFIKRRGEQLVSKLLPYDDQEEENSDTVAALPLPKRGSWSHEMRRNHSHESYNSNTSYQSHQSRNSTGNINYTPEHGPPDRRPSHDHWHSNPHEVLHTPETQYGFRGAHSEPSTSRLTRHHTNPLPRPQSRSPVHRTAPSRTDRIRPAPKDVHDWKENPRPFCLDYTQTEPAKERIKGIPVCARLSGSGESVAILSRRHINVYTVSTKSTSKLKLDSRIDTEFTSKNSRESNEFISAALNDCYVAGITRDRLEIFNFAHDFHPTGIPHTRVQTLDDHRVLRLCRVAMSTDIPVTLVAVGLVDRDSNPVIQIYELQESKGRLTTKLQRSLDFGAYSDQPFGEPSELSFSPDGTYLICTSSVLGDILTWNLDDDNNSPNFKTVVPVNDGRGYGIIGVTSATLFPSKHYMLVTTGLSYSPAVIKSISDRERPYPGPVDINHPQASIIASTVSAEENAFALLTKKGKIFVSKLESNGTSGYRPGAQDCVASVSHVHSGYLKFATVGASQVLVAVLIISPPLKSVYKTKVLRFKF